LPAGEKHAQYDDSTKGDWFTRGNRYSLDGDSGVESSRDSVESDSTKKLLAAEGREEKTRKMKYTEKYRLMDFRIVLDLLMAC
jgi:hypothetical protein